MLGLLVLCVVRLVMYFLVNHAFEIIHLLTDKTPLEVCVEGPREESTHVGSAGVVRGQAGDVCALQRWRH